MNIKEAISVITNHQKAHLKQRSIYSYNYVLKRFEQKYGNRQVEVTNYLYFSFLCNSTIKNE